MQHNAAVNETSRSGPKSGAHFYFHARAQKDLVAFAREIDLIGEEIRRSSSLLDFQHLKKHARWGQLFTLTGYASAWLFPNPLAPIFLAIGNYARWALVFHPISHGAMDAIADVPARYTSRSFAQGVRRYWQWLDWIVPANWKTEHNQLHHYHLGSHRDPDVVWRNTRVLRSMKAPLGIRYALAAITVCIWKPAYYAPNTMMEARFSRGDSDSKQITWRTWNPLASEGRELWLHSLLPYVFGRFVLIPSLFFPLGTSAVIAVLLNSVFAEVLANIYSFAVIGTNHTGDDIFTFTDAPISRGDYYLRQILGTVNFPSNSEADDFFYGGMNFQIEHHLWPKASLYQCKRVRPRLKALCAEYGIPYQESPLLPRFKMTMKTMVGSAAILEVSTHEA